MIGLQVPTSFLRRRTRVHEAAFCRHTPSRPPCRPDQAPSLNSLVPNYQGPGPRPQAQGPTGAPRKSPTDLPPQLHNKSCLTGTTRCDTEFKRKFDWKRHEDEFHERYKKYPCPDCNRVFWGANTFNQHHKTRHSCKTCPHADKVIQYTRKKRAWACGFCAAFLPSMDRYIDHIGLHYESGRTKAHWYHSNVIYGLLHQPGVNAAWKNIIGSRFSHIPKDQQPRYGWDQKTTGRKQGFLENETAGNLQDLLEFFNPTKDDSVKVARLAFDMAELLPANMAPGRQSLDVPDKSPSHSAAALAPKRGKTSASTSSSASRRKASSSSNNIKIELALPPAAKERPITQWPSGFSQTESIPEMPRSAEARNGGDTHMPDFDATAVPQPLFAASALSPTHPPPPSYSQHQPPPPSISISPSSDQPTFLSPTTPLQPPTPTTPFTGGAPMPRDTVVDLLQDYMHDPMPDVVGGPTPDMSQQPHAHMGQQPLCQHPPFGQYEDWNSICSTMVDDLASPRHNGPPLPPAPHDQPHASVRRSDYWEDGHDRIVDHESIYMDDVQACDLASLPPPPPMHQPSHHVGRRSDVWATSAVDYEGLGYENEVAAPPPPSANWL